LTEPRKVHWMRYIVGDAGNLQRLYWAVKTASEVQAENLQTLCEIFLRKFRTISSQGKRKRGFLKSKWRSAEPHFSFARELDLLEWRERELWRLTFGAGRTFIALWDKGNVVPPRYLLLAQLLTYDRSFLIPLLLGLAEANYDFSVGKFRGLEKIAREAWEEVWSLHGRELQSLDPPLPSPKEVKDRTLLHHATARVRFLNTYEGIGLNMEKLQRLSQQFYDFQFAPQMPSDFFFRIGTALSGARPTEISGQETTDRALEALSVLQRADHASGYGIFLYINEKSLPSHALDWNSYVTHVRKEKPFSIRASFRRDDFLVTVERVQQVVR